MSIFKRAKSYLLRKRAPTTGGFTLLELLVAMIISSIVIGSLLSFMLSILNTDRREQAKSNSEQELQAALDYITRDLQQAFYIYDATALNNSSTDTVKGIKDQIPPVASAPGCTSADTCRPVLVFWKREFLAGRDDSNAATAIGGLETLANGNDSKQDYFRHSLVAYYLIKDNDTTWSQASRIGRFEIRDGIRTAQTISGAATCHSSATATEDCKRTENSRDVYYLLAPSKGFQLFDLSASGDLAAKMRVWKKHSDAYANSVDTLIDYVDQSTANVPTPACATGTLVPDQSTLPAALQSGSFYACVESTSTRTLADVYLRGNALARIQRNAAYNEQASAFFPQTNARIRGRGLLGTE